MAHLFRTARESASEEDLWILFIYCIIYNYTFCFSHFFSLYVELVVVFCLLGTNDHLCVYTCWMFAFLQSLEEKYGKGELSIEASARRVGLGLPTVGGQQQTPTSSEQEN